jgi:hypothetical protein
VAVFACGLYKNSGLLENGSSWTRNVYRTPIANQDRPIEWSSYFHHATPPTGSFRFRSVQKSRITRERWQLDEKCLQNTNSKSGSVYRMVKLLLLSVATYRQCPLPVRFNDCENRELLENGGCWMRNVYRTPIANQGRQIEWSSYFHHAAPPTAVSASGLYKNRGLLENGGSWTRNVYRTPIANQGRPIKWSSYFS